MNLTKGKGTLSADVADHDETTQGVVLADLSSPSPTLTAKDDVITLDKVTATLTEAGAKAFGGFYAAGAELDPVSLAVSLTEGAELPAGTGGNGTGGSGTGTDGGPDGSGSTTGGVGSTVGGDLGGSLASTGSDVPVGALGAAAGAAVAAGAGVVLALRRRRATAG